MSNREVNTYSNLDEDVSLAVVDTDLRSNHLGDDDHVTEVGLDDDGLATILRLLLGLAEATDEVHGDVSTGELSAGTRVHEVHELSMLEVKEVLNLKTAVEKAAERLALDGGFFRLHRARRRRKKRKTYEDMGNNKQNRFHHQPQQHARLEMHQRKDTCAAMEEPLGAAELLLSQESSRGSCHPKMYSYNAATIQKGVALQAVKNP